MEEIWLNGRSLTRTIETNSGTRIFKTLEPSFRLSNIEQKTSWLSFMRRRLIQCNDNNDVC